MAKKPQDKPTESANGEGAGVDDAGAVASPVAAAPEPAPAPVAVIEPAPAPVKRSFTSRNKVPLNVLNASAQAAHKSTRDVQKLAAEAAARAIASVTARTG